MATLISNEQYILLQQDTLIRYCARADHYTWAVLCRSDGVLSANENEGDNESNESPIYYKKSTKPSDNIYQMMLRRRLEELSPD